MPKPEWDIEEATLTLVGKLVKYTSNLNVRIQVVGVVTKVCSHDDQFGDSYGHDYDNVAVMSKADGTELVVWLKNNSHWEPYNSPPTTGAS